MKIMAHFQCGGLVEMAASGVDFDRSYTFEFASIERQMGWRWTGVRPTRQGDEAVFDLRPEDAIVFSPKPVKRGR